MDGGRRGLGARCGILFSIALVGVAATSRSGAQPAVTAVATDTRIGDRAVTARLDRRAGAATGTIAVLTIEAIQGRSVQPIRINVFVDKPDADHATPTTDSRCAGFIQLLPRDGVVRKTGAVLDVSNLLPRDPTAPVDITLVPVIGTGSEPPKGVDLEIGRMLIEYEKE